MLSFPSIFELTVSHIFYWIRGALAALPFFLREGAYPLRGKEQGDG